jgi:gp16 family phage-associated protein
MTPYQVKKILSEHGMSVRDFARRHGFSDSLVYAVLAGKNKATRGESHRIAFALGLKPIPKTTELPGFLSEFYQLGCNKSPPLVSGLEVPMK